MQYAKFGRGMVGARQFSADASCDPDLWRRASATRVARSRRPRRPLGRNDLFWERVHVGNRGASL